jgi:hypothetical protein
MGLTPECIPFLPPKLKVLSIKALSLPISYDTRVLDQDDLDDDVALLVLQVFLNQYTSTLSSTITDLSLQLRYRHWTVCPKLDHLPESLVRYHNSAITILGDHISQTTTSIYDANSAVKSPDRGDMEIALVPAPWGQNERKRCCLPVGLQSISTRGVPLYGTLILGLGFNLDLLWIRQHAGATLKCLQLYNVDLTHLPLLPSTLEKLSLSSTTPFEDSHMLCLPDSLTQLDLSQAPQVPSHLTDECVPALPHDLVSLSFDGATRIRGDKYHWPAKLTRLHLNCLGLPLAHHIVPLVPHWATYLEYCGYNLRDDLFSRVLPPFLTQLLILTETQLTGAFFALLPDTLTHIRVDHISLQDKDIGSLPRYLKRFQSSKGGDFLTDNSAPCWPPLLQSLCHTGSLYTREALRALPRSLKVLVLPKAKLIDPNCCQELLPPNCSWSVGDYESR